MEFYKLWLQAKSAGINENSFILEFLNQTEPTLATLYEGTEIELIDFSNCILNTSLDSLIELLDLNKQSISQDRIVQFSNYDNGVKELNILLLFENRKLDFIEIGKKLINAKLDGACKKYGENHSKLAYELNLVNLEKEKRYVVTNTKLGEFLVSIDYDTKKEILKRLWLRNPFIKEMIIRAKNGDCNYSELASQYLSQSTVLRRKSNVKYVLGYILEESNYEFILNNITW